MRLVLSLGFCLAALPAAAASFDCSKAATPTERAICSDPRLSALDSQIGAAFAQVRSVRGRAAALAIARPFLRQRDACGADRACILAAQQAVLEQYRVAAASAPANAPEDAPRSGALPTRIGLCVTTTVAQVGPRLSSGETPSPEDFDSGTSIAFANGGYQVSYEREPALLQSKVGDPVEMCLESVPQDCPPGDDRGRVYRSTNLRTGQSWSLPDSQHACGGA